jgi:hypothetical protein
MNMLCKRAVVLLPVAVGAAWILGCSDRPVTGPSIRAAASGGSGVTVTATSPDSAPQGITLDVHVLGSGYDRGSLAQWARNGALSPNVQTNATQFVSSSELLANITIASIADTGLYDVLVTTSKGKKGIGSELFTIKKRTGPPPSANPQIAFWNGGNLQVMNADGSNVTTIYSTTSGAGRPSWAPSGEGTLTNPYHLVFEPRNDGTCPLAMIDVDTTGDAIHARNLRDFAATYVACAPSWSPQGDEIAYGGAQAGASPSQIGPSPLFVIPSGGGSPTALYTPPLGSYVFHSTWRADGSAIAFTEVLNNDYAVRVYNRPTGAVTTIVSAGVFVDIGDLSWAHTQDLLALSVHRATHNKILAAETDTVRLGRDASGNVIAVGGLGTLTGGLSGSWSPNDARVVVTGINIYDLVSGVTQRLANGYHPDWRRF